MSIIVSSLAFFALLTVLVLIHELGHFLAAKKAGVKVEEFGFGLPPRAKTLFWRKGTRFSLNWVPFGGFVRLQGESVDAAPARQQPGSFARASIPARVVILTAGVFMNFVCAVLIFTFGFSYGRWIPTYMSFEEMESASARGELHMIPGVLIEELSEGGSAVEAKLPSPSILLKVDGVPVRSPEDVLPLQKGKEAVTYTVLTGKEFQEERTFTLPLLDGKAGVALRSFPRELRAPRRPVHTAFFLAVREARVVTVQTVLGIAALFESLVRQGRVPAGITGIVGIAQLTHESIQEGFMTYLRLVALLNLSLAALNILPFPALDGGRLLFVIVEAIRQRPANRRFELTTNAVGFLLLILLILLITYHDIITLLFPVRL